MSDKKLGRPFSSDPKSVRITIRLTKSETEKLDAFCKLTDMERNVAIREAIKRLPT